MVLTFSSFQSTDNPLTNQMPNCTIANRQYLHSNSMLCINLKRKISKMACSSEEAILFGVAFEEAFVEEIRSYRCLWDPMSRGFKDTSMKNNAFKAIGEKYGRTGWYKFTCSYDPLYSYNVMKYYAND